MAAVAVRFLRTTRVREPILQQEDLQDRVYTLKYPLENDFDLYLCNIAWNLLNFNFWSYDLIIIINQLFHQLPLLIIIN